MKWALALLCLALPAACSPPTNPRSVATPVVEAVPEADAFLSVDRRATLALKQVLVTRFPQNSPPAKVEQGLAADGYECGPDPTTPDERACLKVSEEAGCQVNVIVRVQPYRPEVAQVIRACAVE